MNRPLDALSPADLTARLAADRAQPPRQDEGSLPEDLFPNPARPAAVLIALLRQDHAWHLLYTHRTAHLAEHSDQVAFPGGRADPDDPSPQATALREAQEEIGLDPAEVTLLGALPPVLTITNYRVTPIVGLIPWPTGLRLSPAEVSRVFTLPLAWLADPANWERRTRQIAPQFPPFEVIHYQPYSGEVLWGISAYMTQRLIAALTA